MIYRFTVTFFCISIILSCGNDPKENLAPEPMTSVDACKCYEARISGELTKDTVLQKDCEKLAFKLGRAKLREQLNNCPGFSNVGDVDICDCKAAMISGELDSNEDLLQACNALASSMTDRDFDMALEACSGDIPDEVIEEAERTNQIIDRLKGAWENPRMNLSLGNDGTYLAVRENDNIEEGIWTFSRDTLVLISDSVEHYHPLLELTADKLTLKVNGTPQTFNAYSDGSN